MIVSVRKSVHCSYDHSAIGTSSAAFVYYTQTANENQNSKESDHKDILILKLRVASIVITVIALTLKVISTFNTIASTIIIIY